jgi:hypothetical protein
LTSDSDDKRTNSTLSSTTCPIVPQMVTRQRQHQVTCSGPDSPSLHALPDPERESTMTLRNVRKHTNNRTPHDLKHHLNYTFPRTLGFSVFFQVLDQTFLFVLYLTMRATRPPISREVPILRQTDRQMVASTKCRGAQFPQFPSLSGRLLAGDPHRRSPPAACHRHTNR